MRWPSRSKPAPPASFAVGPYRLDGAIEGLGGLLEFSPSEYAAMGRQFVGEKDYNALPVDFLGRSWDVMVQAVHGRICAIAPYVSLTDSREAERVAKQVFLHCGEQLGEPAERRENSVLWRTRDGSVLLRTEAGAGSFRIGLFLTSDAIGHLQRL